MAMMWTLGTVFLMLCMFSSYATTHVDPNALFNLAFHSKDKRVISCQVKQHMHLMFLIWLNFSIYIGLHMSSHFPILYVHNLNGCRITQH